MLINVALLLSTSWILISLIYHGIRSGKWRKIYQNSNPDKLNRGIVYSSVVVVAIICLLHLSFSLAFVNVEFNDKKDELCNFMGDITYFLYGLTILASLTFLWIRQRIFFNHRILNATYSKPVKLFSISSIVVIYGSGIAMGRYWVNHFSSPNGCGWELNLKYHVIPVFFAFLILSSSFGQFAHLCLFVHALRATNDLKSKHFSSKIVSTPSRLNNHHNLFSEQENRF